MVEAEGSAPENFQNMNFTSKHAREEPPSLPPAGRAQPGGLRPRASPELGKDRQKEGPLGAAPTSAPSHITPTHPAASGSLSQMAGRKEGQRTQEPPTSSDLLTFIIGIASPAKKNTYKEHTGARERGSL